MKTGEQQTACNVDINYLPTVAWFSRTMACEPIVANANGWFRKSTWQNRCRIIGPNGPVLLTIPIIGGRGTKQLLRDVCISYDERWQQVHWNSLCAAYGKSSFFNHYAARFKPFYESKPKFLLDLNIPLLHTCFNLLHLSKKIVFDENATLPEQEPTGNHHSSNKDLGAVRPYYQVFREKHGFVDNLSIVDLLFNMGPEAINYLLAAGKEY